MKIVEKEACCGCGACMQQCPKSCIVMVSDEEGFRYPQVNKATCIGCGRCEKVCPSLAIRKRESIQSTYAVKAQNDVIREKSSSGGVFSVLAEAILSEGGIVIGAVMDKQHNVKHSVAEDAQGVALMRGSKYIQSDMREMLEVVKKQLEIGRKVLFSGTPCQIASLKNYLGHEDENLICVDIICHGTASKRAFESYLHKLEATFQSKVQQVDFRYKGTGWNNYSMKINFTNGKVYAQTKNKDEFLQGFIQNRNLRPSCYNCKYKDNNSGSDICLGDLWGSRNLFPRWDDNKGISAVLIKTQRGLEIFEKIKGQIDYKNVSYAQIASGNPSLEHRTTPNIKPNKLSVIWKKIIRKAYAVYRYLRGY